MTWYLTSILTGLAATIAILILVPGWWDIPVIALIWFNRWATYRNGVKDGERACCCLEKIKV